MYFILNVFHIIIYYHTIFFLSQNSAGGGNILKTESSQSIQTIDSQLDNIATDQDLRTTVLKNNMQRKENEK